MIVYRSNSFSKHLVMTESLYYELQITNTARNVGGIRMLITKLQLHTNTVEITDNTPRHSESQDSCSSTVEQCTQPT